MADDKKWVTINGAHIPIENGKPQYGSDKKETKSEDDYDLKEQDRRSKFFEDDEEDFETVEVDLTADIQKQFDNATPKERSKIAYRYIMDNLRGKYPAHDGLEITISSVGADKMSHTTHLEKIRVLPELARLIQAGRARGVINVEHKKFDKMAYYDVAFKVGKDYYRALLNVGILKDGVSTLYDINPFNKQ
ncbi:MAG: hypothetical protein OSJ74_00120 [Clostridia bacterium]|nr:hypothetical protein [Clostridia bacterium]